MASRPDRYDYIGMGLLGLLAVIWILHFVLPTPPPEPEIGGPAPATSLPFAP